jgi:hypothetical protein
VGLILITLYHCVLSLLLVLSYSPYRYKIWPCMYLCIHLSFRSSFHKWETEHLLNVLLKDILPHVELDGWSRQNRPRWASASVSQKSRPCYPI